MQKYMTLTCSRHALSPISFCFSKLKNKNDSVLDLNLSISNGT